MNTRPTDDQLKKFVEQRYAHLTQDAREQLLAAYIKSARRDPDVLLKQRGVYVENHVPSDQYKDHLFNDSDG